MQPLFIASMYAESDISKRDHDASVLQVILELTSQSPDGLN